MDEFFYPMAMSQCQEVGGPGNIGLYEAFREKNASVNVRFGGKMDHCIGR